MNPWDKVRQLRWAYRQRITAELKACESHIADRQSAAKQATWRDALESKSVAYRDYEHVVREAVNSGIHCPW